MYTYHIIIILYINCFWWTIFWLPSQNFTHGLFPFDPKGEP